MAARPMLCLLFGILFCVCHESAGITKHGEDHKARKQIVEPVVASYDSIFTNRLYGVDGGLRKPPTLYSLVLIAASPKPNLAVGILLCVSHESADITKQHLVPGCMAKITRRASEVWNLLLYHMTQR